MEAVVQRSLLIILAGGCCNMLELNLWLTNWRTVYAIWSQWLLRWYAHFPSLIVNLLVSVVGSILRRNAPWASQMRIFCHMFFSLTFCCLSASFSQDIRWHSLSDWLLLFDAIVHIAALTRLNHEIPRIYGKLWIKNGEKAGHFYDDWTADVCLQSLVWERTVQHVQDHVFSSRWSIFW